MATKTSISDVQSALQTAHDYLNNAGVLNHPALGQLNQAFQNTGLVNGNKPNDVPSSTKPSDITLNPWTSDPNTFIHANLPIMQNGLVPASKTSTPPGVVLTDYQSPPFSSSYDPKSKSTVITSSNGGQQPGLKPFDLSTLTGVPGKPTVPTSMYPAPVSSDLQFITQPDASNSKLILPVNAQKPSIQYGFGSTSPYPSIGEYHPSPNEAVVRDTDVDARQLFNEFVKGTGPTRSLFLPNNDFTKMVQALPSIQERRQVIINNARLGKGTDQNLDFNYGHETLPQRLGHFVKDGVEGATDFAPNFGDPVESLLGTYHLYAKTTKVDRTNRTVDVDFHLKNSTGKESLTRNPVTGYNKGAKSTLSNTSSGPLSTKYQDAFWSERLHY